MLFVRSDYDHRSLTGEKKTDLKVELGLVHDTRLFEGYTLLEDEDVLGLWLSLGLGSWNCGIQSPIGDAGKTLTDR